MTWSPSGIVADVGNWKLDVSKFERYLRYNVHFKTNAPKKAINPPIAPSMG